MELPVLAAPGKKIIIVFVGKASVMRVPWISMKETTLGGSWGGEERSLLELVSVD